MAPRAKPMPPDHGMLDSQKLAERIKSDLATCQVKVGEMESKLRVTALDALSDPAAYQRAEDEITAERRKARQLAAAVLEAERRVELELAEIRYRKQRAKCDRVLKYLAARDEIGAEVEKLTTELAAKFRALVSAGDKVRAASAGLLPDAPGFLTGPGELDQALSNEFWRVSAADIGSLLTGRPGVVAPPPSLPGSLAILRTGSPMPYTPADAPSLTVRLAEATQFAKGILEGERTFAGPPSATPPQSEWIWPGRDPATLEAYKARGRGTVPLDGQEATAGAEPRGAIAEAAQRVVNAITGRAAEGPTGTGPQMLPGETEIEFAKRLAATPVAPLTDAEREALNRPPTGPTKTAAEVMSAMVGGRRTTIYDEAVGRKRKDGDEW